MHLNWFDYVLIALGSLSVLISFFRGLVREVVSLLIWVAGVILAMHFAPELAAKMQSFISSPVVCYVIAFVLIFLGAFILGLVVNVIVRRLVNASGLSLFDRFFGAIFGIARGVLLAALIMMFISMTSMQSSDWFIHSGLGPELRPMSTWLSGFLPQQLKQVGHWIQSDMKHEATTGKADQTKEPAAQPVDQPSENHYQEE